ncbi:acetyl esterase/lipase [Chryseobacterium geocarposphaerae]|uniref:Acetyl esterase/lipase n=2 Tax=Chryseobacterium geocarposphaerae TaxID=1416776 RepID=A0A2M9C126_9FLAO|nr:acetyl esterase/lipase [Chryseobacterium geocarposphaerae]
MLGKNLSFTVEKNLSYGNNSEQKLDFYLPKNRSSIKGIFVLIHGGGWKAGDKSNLNYFALSMMEKFPDYAFANINYRLADNTSFILPNQTNDIDSVLDFLVKKTSAKKIDPQFILLGNSAGAHLSLLYGYNRLFDSKYRTKVKAIVNIVGPSDLRDPNFANYTDYSFVQKHMIDLTKPTPTDITNLDIPNPVLWINETSPPTISFYGNRDQVIPLSQKKILDSVLNKNNVYNRSYEFSGGHLDWSNESNAPFVINSIYQFLKPVDKTKTP